MDRDKNLFFRKGGNAVTEKRVDLIILRRKMIASPLPMLLLASIRAKCYDL